MDITKFRINNAPPSIHYIPNFITTEEENEIIRNVYAAPKPKWTCLSNRRLQDYGGVPHEKGMISEKIPEWLQKYMKKVKMLNIFQDKSPNQVLVNEYLPGQGIMPHTDGPLFFPIISTISCGSHTILSFLENSIERKKVCDLLLERRSLIIVQDDMYSKYLHSIDEKTCDILDKDCVNLRETSELYEIGQKLERQTRISVTIRNAPKVLKLKLWK